MSDDQIPVTILSGTLGAGKTTTLNHILTADHDHDVAVLVNDVGEVNVDAEAIERRLDGDDVVELSNGCICCGLQGELTRTVVDLGMSQAFEHLLIEPSGISEPAPVAEQFAQGRPGALYDIDSVATVVDARQFYDAFEDGTVERRGETDSGTRPLSDLIVDGVEFCDTLLVNKCDLVDDDELEQVCRDLRTLQPEAKLVKTEFGVVPPGELLGTGRFDPDRVSGSASWRQTLSEHGDGSDEDAGADHDHSGEHDHDHSDHDHDHKHPPEEYGIDSFVFHEVEPLHPDRLAAFLRETPAELIRAKGWLHVAGRPEQALDLSLAGTEAHVTVAGRWIASLPEDRQELYRERRDPSWTEQYGDRETKLVMIGQDLDQSAVEGALAECVTTETERACSLGSNPFPEREGQRLQL